MSPTDSLATARLLDVRYHVLRGTVPHTKDETLAAIARVFRDVPYAVIGDVAVQLRRSEPRTTVDVDLAVPSYDAVPRAALEAAGFRELGSHAHSQNWIGPDGTPLQLTDDPGLASAIASAEDVHAGALVLRVATPLELVRAKLRAARDPARRRSKRLQDLADAVGLVEDHPHVRASLDDEERSQLEA